MAFSKFTVFASAITLAAVVAAPMANAKDWRGWNIHVEDYPVSHGMEAFMAEVTEKTGGEIKGKVFHQGVLGSQPDAIEQVRLGIIDFAEFNLGPMGQAVPEANVVSLPFIFKSIDQMHRAMDGAPGEALSTALADKGLIALGYYDAGARSFYNSKGPINTPADVEGMKVRVMNNDLFVNMIAAMGGNATPMAFAEVYQSLKTNVVDGAENNPPSYESTAHYEVAPFYSMSEHLIIPEVLVVSKKAWEGLTPEQQEIVKVAGKNSTMLQRELWAEREAKSMEVVKAAGVQVNMIEDKTPFQEAMAPVYETYLTNNPDMKGIVELFQNFE
ncbi:TRAP transporter substrate-binding protein [Aliiruegeria sabulilitoris]|uniref:TRAP transporter substrate-binding protein n=1 Tax=Aliiruegeria sabulilitoris TaxID=1510458 RepID=UPI0008375B6A|nr:TRAP transporter substrate-binding protein [Aliiruegeria sabulilitoris]NDR54834.1 TRAP transporter substrate-binding protein [Pseudoruegeria sp. M32A2M]